MRRPDGLAAIGLGLVAIFALAALAAPIVATHDPGVIDAVRRLEGPSRAHLLGTDNLGRDILPSGLWIALVVGNGRYLDGDDHLDRHRCRNRCRLLRGIGR